MGLFGAAKPDLPKRPEEPHELECCGRGCDPCIFDYYERALSRWEAKVRGMGYDPETLLPVEP